MGKVAKLEETAKEIVSGECKTRMGRVVGPGSVTKITINNFAYKPC